MNRLDSPATNPKALSREAAPKEVRVQIDALQRHPKTKLGLLLAQGASRGTRSLRRRLLKAAGVPLQTYLEQRLQQVSRSTIAKELGQLGWLADRGMIPMTGPARTLMADVNKAIRKTPHQARHALPMTHEWVCALTRRTSPLTLSSQALIQLTFLSASRVDDCISASKEALAHLLKSGVMIFGKTKTNSAATARPDHHVRVQVVRGTALHRFLTKERYFKPHHARKLAQELAMIEVPKNYVKFWNTKAKTVGESVIPHFTMHSMKRGAADCLWKAAAANKITIDQLKAQLKHERLQSSLAYAPDRSLVATAVHGDHSILNLPMPTYGPSNKKRPTALKLRMKGHE